MTWTKLDDACSTHPKARLAGNEAWALWAAAVVYCNRYLIDGFVPLEALANDCLPVPISAVRARKLAERLVEARICQGGAGLFERSEHGYFVHDFLDWNPSKAEVEERQARARERKIPPDLRAAVMQRDGWNCGICGQPIEPGSAVHIDHALPVSRGGATEFGNLRPAHPRCNLVKGARV